jgi:hypothetical protein
MGSFQQVVSSIRLGSGQAPELVEGSLTGDVRKRIGEHALVTLLSVVR